MELSIYSLKIINQIKSNLKIGNKLIAKIPDVEKSFLMETYNTNNVISSLYCMAKNSTPSKCICCGMQTQFLSIKDGFRKFCSVSCSLKVNNKIYNKEKVIKTKKQNFEKIESTLKLCAIEYQKDSNNKTLTELSKEFNVTYFSLRKYIIDNKLFPKTPINKIKQNEKMLLLFPELFDINFFLLKQKEGKTTKTVASELGVSPNTISLYARKLNVPFINLQSRSRGEQEIYEYLNDTYKIILNNKETIYPFELDLFLPELNLAIEFNGSYWHSEGSGKTKTYHQNKFNLCSKKNIRLIQIFDFEWETRKTQTKWFIDNTLNRNIFEMYDDVELRFIQTKEANSFYNSNHIHGNQLNLNFNIGFFFKKQLVFCVSLNQIDNSNLEILKFCPKINLKVNNWLEKTLQFIKHNSMFNIISINLDKRLFDPSPFIQYGFKLVEEIEPCIFWANEHKSTLLSNPKLEKLIQESGMREEEFMMLNGYFKIWDCGNTKYQLKI